ncbi:mCG144946, partial [Mus musculus]
LHCLEPGTLKSDSHEDCESELEKHWSELFALPFLFDFCETASCQVQLACVTSGPADAAYKRTQDNRKLSGPSDHSFRAQPPSVSFTSPHPLITAKGLPNPSAQEAQDSRIPHRPVSICVNVLTRVFSLPETRAGALLLCCCSTWKPLGLPWLFKLNNI